MDWLEQNLDAYRIIGEVLNDLRTVIRDRLEAVHGKSWYKIGLPAGLLDGLIEIKEREKAIDWYESEYQQLMSYAVFPDLLQILDHDPDLFPQVTRLAPTTALLHARFLELEVMRSKLGRARPISDTELAFLGTFHLRFRKAIDDFRDGAPAPSKASPTAGEQAQSGAAKTASEPAAGSDTPPAGTTSSAPPDSRKTGAPETPLDGSDTDPNLWRDEAEPQVTTIRRPPQRLAEKRAAPDADEAAKPAPAEHLEAEALSVHPGDEPAPQAEPTIDDALQEGDDRSVLRALYHEVTHIAEGIWAKEVLPSTKVWDKVSTSTWYERNFSRLGLKPLSDYYEVISKVDRKMREGTSKQDLQDYLKQSNFAQVLLALRDVFQRNQV